MNRPFTTRENVMLVILALLLIGIGYFKLFLEPLNASIATYQADTAAEQDEIMIDTVSLTKMQQMQRELEEIYDSGEAKPLPTYDNSDALLVELHRIMSKASDYSLNFGAVTELEGAGVMCRPLSLTFTAGSYTQARAILTELHESEEVNQISDLSVQFADRSGGAVEVTLFVTYYELEK